MEIKEIECKTALSKSNLPGLDYSLNPYRGCQHGCAYCYVPNVLRIPRKEWGCFVDVKTNIPVILSKELKKKKPGVISISTVTDPYQPAEKKYELTRFCLEQLLRYDFPIHIQTKSKLVIRDLDIISKFSDKEIMFSIATLDDNERKALEPYSSSIDDRLIAMKKCTDEGIKTTVFFGPVYPTIKIEDLEKIIDTFIKNGAKEIMIDKLNLKPGIFENVIRFLPAYSNLINDSNNYKNILEKIEFICNKKNVKAISAF